MTNGGKEQGFTDYYLETLFHHEFSSILLRNYDFAFNEDRWRKINPSNFSYSGDGTEAIEADEASEEMEDYLLEKGFLHEYALSSLENDFNSFAQNIFRNNGQFWDIVDKYRRIEEKMELTVEFYHCLDPVFTKEYFQSISSEER